jgi:hypothetical protein
MPPRRDGTPTGTSYAGYCLPHNWTMRMKASAMNVRCYSLTRTADHLASSRKTSWMRSSGFLSFGVSWMAWAMRSSIALQSFFSSADMCVSGSDQGVGR